MLLVFLHPHRLLELPILQIPALPKLSMPTMLSIHPLPSNYMTEYEQNPFSSYQLSFVCLEHFATYRYQNLPTTEKLAYQ
jgi:hypothetical protein